MNKKLLLILSPLTPLFVLIAPALGQQASTPILENPGFEQHGHDEQHAATWGLWGPKIGRTTDWKPTMEGPAMMAYRHWEVTGDADSGFFQDAKNITSGTKYIFRVPVFVDQPEEGKLTGEIELRLEATIDGQQVTVASESINPNDLTLESWQILEASGTAPGDNLRALVRFVPAKDDRGGTIKIDSVTLESLP